MTANESPAPASPASDASSDAGFARAKLPMLVAIGLVSLGLAIAGTLDKTVGGVLVVAAWALGVVALHRLGRAGSYR